MAFYLPRNPRYFDPPRANLIQGAKEVELSYLKEMTVNQSVGLGPVAGLQ